MPDETDHGHSHATVPERIASVRRHKEASLNAMKEFILPLLSAVEEVKEASPEDGFGISLTLQQNGRHVTLNGKLDVPQFDDTRGGPRAETYEVLVMADENLRPSITLERVRVGEGRGAKGETEEVRVTAWSKTFADGMVNTRQMGDLVELIREAATVYVTSRDEMPDTGFRV